MSMDLSISHNLSILFKQCSFFVIDFQNQHRSTTFGTTQRVVSERNKYRVSPVLNGFQEDTFFLGDTFSKKFFLFMMFGIDAIITEHFEMFLRDVNDKSLDEVESRNCFSNRFIIFVTCIVKGHIFSVVSIDARSGNHRSSKISADIFNSDIRSA